MLAIGGKIRAQLQVQPGCGGNKLRPGQSQGSVISSTSWREVRMGP